jgi:hypothetical protein
MSFAVERRRGWTEAAGSPPRDPGDVWDERRAQALRMAKLQPSSGGAVRLEVSGGYAAFRSRGYSADVAYRIVDGGRCIELDGVQWAEWAADGTLLVATATGRLEVRGRAGWLTADVVVADLSQQTPAPAGAPAWARSWTRGR